MSAKPSGKKVLFFQHSNHNGGAPRSLFQIVSAYEKEFGPQAVLFIRPGPVLKTYESLSSKVICGRLLLPFHGSEVSGMSWKLAVRNILGLLMVPGGTFRYLRGYDVVYLNSSALCFYGLALRLFSPRTRIIFHIREPLLDNPWGQVIRFALGRSADRYLAISRNEMRNLRLPGVPGEVVYNYVHSEDYAPARGRSLHRADPKVGPEKFAVGYFARVDAKNGIEDFLRLARAFEDRPDMSFCVYGHTGREGGEIQSLIARAGPNVHVYPMVADVPENLGDLDVLVVPFKAPHFSRSVIEAAMLGVPSIIYDIVSVNETVRDGETGYVVPPNDLEAMRARLSELREDPVTRRRLSEGARAFALDGFSERNYFRIREAINASTPARS